MVNTFLWIADGAYSVLSGFLLFDKSYPSSIEWCGFTRSKIIFVPYRFASSSLTVWPIKKSLSLVSEHVLPILLEFTWLTPCCLLHFLVHSSLVFEGGRYFTPVIVKNPICKSVLYFVFLFLLWMVSRIQSQVLLSLYNCRRRLLFWVWQDVASCGAAGRLRVHLCQLREYWIEQCKSKSTMCSFCSVFSISLEEIMKAVYFAYND